MMCTLVVTSYQTLTFLDPLPIMSCSHWCQSTEETTKQWGAI